MGALAGEHDGTRETGRLVSLDVFRGLTIAGMILVNNPGTWGRFMTRSNTPSGTGGRRPTSSSRSSSSMTILYRRRIFIKV